MWSSTSLQFSFFLITFIGVCLTLKIFVSFRSTQIKWVIHISLIFDVLFNITDYLFLHWLVYISNYIFFQIISFGGITINILSPRTLCFCTSLIFFLLFFLYYFIFFFSSFFFFFFWGPHLWYMKVPGLGSWIRVANEAYTTAKAIGDLICICNLFYSLWQFQILNPTSEARNQTPILRDTMLCS